MRCHPLQMDPGKLRLVSDLFQMSMERSKVLPVNPWKAKRLERWLGKMGARFEPETHNYRSLNRVDTQNYLNFRVACPPPKAAPGRVFARRPKIRGRCELRWVRIEIPWDLADKVLTLGYLP